jgi:anthranilate phosphoribosyltransferase
MHAHLVAQRGVALLLRGTEGEAFANPRRRPRLEAFALGKAWDAFPAEEGGAPPLETLPDQPEVAANAALIRAMLAGSLPVPQPILDQVAALAELARTPR